jgi:hypothetical protein
LAAAFLLREFFAGAAGTSVPLLSMASARWLMAALSSGASTVTFRSIMVCYLQNLFDVGIGALVVIENGENGSVDDGGDNQERPRRAEHQWVDGEIKADTEKRVNHGVVHSDLNHKEK